MNKKPDWLRVPYFSSESNEYVLRLLEELKLNTVCKEANCPNLGECFSNKTATFMILGTVCTRKCGFCNVSAGTPLPVDSDEPQRIALASKKLRLGYVVITSVTRDDLPDGGALHFANVIKAIHEIAPGTLVEVLIPDLSALEVITDRSPAVIGHNIETVRSLYKAVRPDANYSRSLNVLSDVKRLNSRIRTKSGIMLGLGETRAEVLGTFNDLLNAGCDFLTIGQYLSPGRNNVPVREYIEPRIFDEYKEIAKELGFSDVAAGPFVRSSYRAYQLADKL